MIPPRTNLTNLNPVNAFYIEKFQIQVGQALSQLCRQNFLVFLKMEMGAEVAQHHREWWDILSSGDDSVFLSPRDSGKALATTCPVLSRRGWTTHGELKTGDWVRHSSGGWTQVMAVSSTWVDRPCYEISFRGTKETIVCDGNHLWQVVMKGNFGKRKGHRLVELPYEVKVATTKELVDKVRYRRADGTERQELNLQIPVTRSFLGVGSPKYPWVLGMWLGDGVTSAPYICIFEGELTGKMRRELPDLTSLKAKGLYRSEILKSLLDRYSLKGCKRIPRVYLEAEEKTRLKLLQGLMDSDGSASKGGYHEYCSVKKELAQDVYELILGLGIKASFSESDAKLYGRVVSKRYRITFYPGGQEVCSLVRKNGRRNSEIGRQFWSIAGIREVASVPTSCITVSAEDGMYLAGRSLIATHNSFAMARAYPIWRAKYDPWIREIYVLGADRDSAVENLDKLKALMRSRKSLAYLVPDSRAEGINSRSEVKLRNGVVIKAKGYMSPLRGRHPQMIILDDVLNAKNSDTKDTRERVIKYFYEVVVPMKDKGSSSARARGNKAQIVVIGTAQHREDLYGALLKNKSFRGLKQVAIIDEESHKVLWPERYSYADLVKLRETIGSLTFSKEYQNEPLSDETSLFPLSLFEPLKDKTLSYVRNYSGDNQVYLGADFSIPGSCDGDWSVFFAMEVERKTGMITPLSYWRARPDSIQEQLVQLEFMTQAYNVTMGYLEDNMFQRIYSEHFRKKTNLPLRGHTVSHTGKSSFETGLLSFRPLFENEKVRLPYKTPQDRLMTDHIIQEFNGVVQKKGRIGNESFFDDTAMAWWHALRAYKETVLFSYEMEA